MPSKTHQIPVSDAEHAALSPIKVWDEELGVVIGNGDGQGQKEE